MSHQYNNIITTVENRNHSKVRECLAPTPPIPQPYVMSIKTTILYVNTKAFYPFSF